MDAFNKTKDNVTSSVTGAGKVTGDKAVEIKDGAAAMATNAGKVAAEGFETAKTKAGEGFEAAKNTVAPTPTATETVKDKAVETKKGFFG